MARTLSKRWGELRVSMSFIGQAVAAVGVEDLRRVWTFVATDLAAVRDAGPGRSVGVDIALLAKRCSANADVPAVWFRAMLIEVLPRHGRLDRWREGNGLLHRVFEVAAVFPLPDGPAHADLDQLVITLGAS